MSATLFGVYRVNVPRVMCIASDRSLSAATNGPVRFLPNEEGRKKGKTESPSPSQAHEHRMHAPTSHYSVEQLE